MIDKPQHKDLTYHDSCDNIDNDDNMKNTMIRGIPDDVWADVLIIAGENAKSANSILVSSILETVEKWRKNEKKRLILRLDELNQTKMLQ